MKLVGKNIAIIGGTGTLGVALVEELLQNHSDINHLKIISRDEIKQLRMMNDYPESSVFSIEYLLGNIRDIDRMKEVLKEVDIVIHCAAIKHVEMAEKNPEECYKTNVIGTKNVVEACLINQVNKAVLISTDKINNPSGIYGKSKKQAEELFLEGEKNGKTSFEAVRLGNILGSRASVLEMFNKQKLKGKIKLTHPEATRFFISPKDAARFVLNSICSSDDKCIYIPKMYSLKIKDLAMKIAPECEIEITGLRPGDKLHEELNGICSNNQSVIRDVDFFLN